MSDMPATKQTVTVVQESDLKVQNIKIVVRQFKADEPGFLPQWRKLIALKRGISDVEKAQPEDIDEAVKFLASYITKPESAREKQAILDQITMQEMFNIFDAIQKGASIPPANGGV